MMMFIKAQKGDKEAAVKGCFYGLVACLVAQVGQAFFTGLWVNSIIGAAISTCIWMYYAGAAKRFAADDSI